MIRIDELYYNVFVSAMQHRPDIGLHWFDPFGSTAFEDINNHPLLEASNGRMFFWDQEPLHRDRVKDVFDRFIPIYRNQYNTGPLRLITSEYNSEFAEWACDTYNMVHDYYFFHAWAAIDWYRGYNKTFLMKPFRDRQIKKNFLCLNNIIGGRRKHRLELLSEMVDRELILDSLISFPDTCPYENKTVSELCKQYNIDLGHVELPLKVDGTKNYANQSHKIDIWPFAHDSFVHIVTETVYQGQRQHLTEKTFKPMVMQQPFILVSCRGSLEYLRRYGFKTFHDVWDESYDEKDDDTRIIAIGKLLTQINELSIKEKKRLQQHLIPIVEHNYHWFYSREFEDLLWQEMTDMINKW